MRLQAVFFDFNGVIIDDEPVHMRMFQKVLAEEGMVLRESEYAAKYLAYDDAEAFRRMFCDRQRPYTDAVMEDLIRRKSVHYRAYIRDHLVIFPGVRALLQSLHGTCPLGVVSGALRSEIDFACGKAGLSDFFDVIISAEDVSMSKPCPEGYRKGVQALNRKRRPSRAIHAQRCLAIEDSPGGLRAALAAGMRCVAVANSYPARDLRRAHLVVDSLEALHARDLITLLENESSVRSDRPA